MSLYIYIYIYILSLTIQVVLEVKHSGTTDTDKQIARYDEVAKLLNAIKENVEQINKQKLADNRASDEQERQKIMKTVDVLMQDTASKARDIKGRLEDFKEENKKFEEDPDNKVSLFINSIIYYMSMFQTNN